MEKSVVKLLEQYEQYNLSDIIDYDKFNSFVIVHHSSSIEGSTLSEVETRLLLDENVTPKGKPLEHSLMTRDHYSALQFILQAAKSRREITPEFIQQINDHVMRSTGRVYNTPLGTVDASRGEFRKGNVSAGGSYFVNYSKVEGLVNELSKELNSQLSSCKTTIARLELSFMAHFNLVSIHPFYDGNGRTSRLLMNYIQKINDLPLAIVYKENKADYFTALDETRKENDPSTFKEFMYAQYEKYLKEEIRKYQKLQQSKNRGVSGHPLLF